MVEIVGFAAIDAGEGGRARDVSRRMTVVCVGLRLLGRFAGQPEDLGDVVQVFLPNLLRLGVGLDVVVAVRKAEAARVEPEIIFSESAEILIGPGVEERIAGPVEMSVGQEGGQVGSASVGNGGQLAFSGSGLVASMAAVFMQELK